MNTTRLSIGYILHRSSSSFGCFGFCGCWVMLLLLLQSLVIRGTDSVGHGPYSDATGRGVRDRLFQVRAAMPVFRPSSRVEFGQTSHRQFQGQVSSTAAKAKWNHPTTILARWYRCRFDRTYGTAVLVFAQQRNSHDPMQAQCFGEAFCFQSKRLRGLAFCLGQFGTIDTCSVRKTTKRIEKRIGTVSYLKKQYLWNVSPFPFLFVP